MWSGYHKYAMVADFVINDKKMAVATFQLDSGTMDQLERQSQVKILMESVKNFDHAILAVIFFLKFL